MKDHLNKKNYKLAVLGANGGTGRQVVEQALEQGHRVTAILRSPEKLNITHANLTRVKGDVLQPEALANLLEGKDAVISAIGLTSFKNTVLFSEGAKNTLAAMEKAGVSRAFFISASGLEINPSHSIMVRFATRFILQLLLKNMYADVWRMEAIVKKSGLNWTIMRPPRLTDKGLTGRYRFSINRFLDNGLTISRADLAHYMLSAVASEETFRKTVEVAY